MNQPNNRSKNDYDVFTLNSKNEEVFITRVSAPTVADASLLVETLWPCAIRGKSLSKYPGHRVMVDANGTVDYSGGRIKVSDDEMIGNQR